MTEAQKIIEKINEALCPLCGAPNNCMAHDEEPCWCTRVTVPKELLALVPAEKKNKSCICLNCIQKFNENPDAFKHRD